ncbi:RNA helicase DExH-NPH-II domain [Western grey kangaroopox virus]|uniref:RNA helicase NPH-II n=1 Tax=Western grey kangaroopox virus TaxID=1566307 RepID=A0A2C9DSL0_9POXV|nr:RNA helicase DExH-NPH-II domain [Western grey kangaroopox virus]ATI20993.1 RNA helicase DExH-NPH-II domain [Western grey kangaroopox virus]
MKNIFSVYAFPNNRTLFPCEYAQAELDRAHGADAAAFAHAAFPLCKHRWRNAFVCLRDGTYMLSVELNTGIVCDRVRLSEAAAFEPVSEDARAMVFADVHGRRMSFECYSFVRLHTDPPTRVEELSLRVKRGLVAGGNRMRIFSSGTRTRARTSVGVLGNAAAFSKVSFRSLELDAQLCVFAALAARRQIVLTGGTGVGKTSQVPKVVMWFNYLFGGFDNLEEVPRPPVRVEERPVVLSLPRVALVKLNGERIMRSLGFSEFDGSPVELRYGGLPVSTRTGPRYGMVVSTNKLTLNSLFRYSYVVLDEIHEHDSIADIIVAVARKNLDRIRSLLLMSATLEDDLERLREFLPDPEFIHLEGSTLFPVDEVHFRNRYPSDDRRYGAEEKRNLSTALRRFRPRAGHCGIIFVASVSQCLDYRAYLEPRHMDIAFHVMHGKLRNVPEVLSAVREAEGVSVIISTPYLESSVTIENASHVFDTGRVFVPEPFGGLHTIVSRSMMVQRKGRVGRVMPGVYVYFYDPAEMRPIRKIDHELLYEYILYCRCYGMDPRRDLYVPPSNMELLQRSEEYLDSFGLSTETWCRLICTHFLGMVEYAKVYAAGGESAEHLDAFEREGVLTSEALDAVRALGLVVRVLSARKTRAGYELRCSVMFGPYHGREFRMKHRHRLSGVLYMVTSSTFVR